MDQDHTTDWPFDDPKDVAVFTTKSITQRDAPILHVSHDEDDGAWQFLDGSPDLHAEDAAIVSLFWVVRHDPTVADLADLPLGWRAWRETTNSAWVRQERPTA